MIVKKKKICGIEGLECCTGQVCRHFCGSGQEGKQLQSLYHRFHQL